MFTVLARLLSRKERTMSLSSTAIRRIYRETLSLRKSPPAGIQVVEGEGNDVDIVEVTLEGPEHTPFEDGVFHIRLRFPSDYPSTPPNAHFITKIFHPNIAPRTGEVCVNTLKRDWNSKVTLSDVLITIKSLLIDPNPTSALNEEAGKLLLEDYPAYCSHPLAIRTKPATSGISRKVSEDLNKNTNGSSLTPLTSSQVQNTLPSEEDKKPRLLLFGIGIKRLEDEDGENRPAKRNQGPRRAGKGDLRRL